MSVSPVKRLVLETMWLLDKPAKATEISKDTRLSFPTVMMHLIGLARMGYVKQHEKGYYVITEKGRKVLGFPEITNEKASEILAYLPLEKSFHFYVDIGKPLNIHAASLQDFCDKILKIDIASMEFHINRGDFEVWFMDLGDIELSRKMLLLKEQKIFGENLRQKLYEIVKSRYEELAKIRKNESASM
ncbi:helix-turn-helix transcriptional regulator [Candidatus Bathyarchaeota archaeon]|nr:helix-turn-helix transcriptional regulator [Candidatus Bathyarchaeota archaeon]